MREIKFRMWCKEESAISYELPFNECLTLDGNIVEHRFNQGGQIPDDVKTKNYILMQYTGLKDKNGKEIYEGDILNVPESFDWGTPKQNILVEWHEIGWALNNIQPSEAEIIGNIYENAPLLAK